MVNSFVSSDAARLRSPQSRDNDGVGNRFSNTSDEAELAQLRRLHETLQLEIIAVLESLKQLRESPEYELCQLSERKPGVLEELAAERARLLEKESAELERQADKLAGEIKELARELPVRIV